MSKTSAIERACVAVGGQVKLAEMLGVTPQAVNQWVARSTVPPDRALAVEAATGGLISRYELRPDLYPTDEPPRRRGTDAKPAEVPPA
jgi:DNA-binding transcriptional regulator YdaS (Cro superfamily)